MILKTNNPNAHVEAARKVNWVRGELDGIQFEAKLYDEPSPCGIHGGRISKLYSQSFTYDRSPELQPTDIVTKNIVDTLESIEPGWYMDKAMDNRGRWL